ncbi:sulfite exporter TauE/SafE family protein [Sediminibacterium soli]|uniref:sulfite exporter TauE/SafE family protein n=1 Tax=Sediminibacterium soli TaxID=2698829 RepID=UPI00137AE7D1|nr:sulfite exporter TauE/SafE family protein [Sediminibacterium soli]NCI48268.1 sulfite exporter TauE/SafE family protein [Sediminibacterium soli]
MEIFSQFSVTQWVMIYTAAFIIGLSKSGIKGIDMLTVTLMAIVFGSKSSTGIVLPLLCVADIAAVIYYHRHAQWHHFRRLAPWMIVGILVGVWAGKGMNEAIFRKAMAGIILVTIAIVLWMEYRKSKQVPHHPAFAAATGLAAGFTTMIGNLAGVFSNLYFLAMRAAKNDFIGSAAWIFLFMNLFKLPFQVFFWHNISLKSLSVDAVVIPALALGFTTGVWLVKKIHDDTYRKIVIVLTLIGSVIMLLKR